MKTREETVLRNCLHEAHHGGNYQPGLLHGQRELKCLRGLPIMATEPYLQGDNSLLFHICQAGPKLAGQPKLNLNFRPSFPQLQRVASRCLLTPASASRFIWC